MKMKLTPNPSPVADADREAKIAAGGFGKYYTDNMVMAQWSEATGWADATLQPYGPITLDPAAMVFHYGQAIFEGLKAYKYAAIPFPIYLTETAKQPRVDEIDIA